MRSSVTNTTRVPPASSYAAALANRCWAVPSACFVRAAYPTIHIGLSGVMSAVATPALHCVGSAAIPDTVGEEHEGERGEETHGEYSGE